MVSGVGGCCRGLARICAPKAAPRSSPGQARRRRLCAVRHGGKPRGGAHGQTRTPAPSHTTTTATEAPPCTPYPAAIFCGPGRGSADLRDICNYNTTTAHSTQHTARHRQSPGCLVLRITTVCVCGGGGSGSGSGSCWHTPNAQCKTQNAKRNTSHDNTQHTTHNTVYGMRYAVCAGL
jgi:hypothetical protein